MKISKNGLLSSALVMGVVALLPDAALAQSFKDTVTAVQDGISQVPQVISGFAYILGAGMMIAGAMKLRAHAENPLNEPLQKGLVRLAIGAAIAGLPALAQWTNTSLSIGNQTFQYKALPPAAEGGGR